MCFISGVCWWLCFSVLLKCHLFWSILCPNHWNILGDAIYWNVCSSLEIMKCKFLGNRNLTRVVFSNMVVQLQRPVQSLSFPPRLLHSVHLPSLGPEFWYLGLSTFLDHKVHPSLIGWPGLQTEGFEPALSLLSLLSPGTDTVAKNTGLHHTQRNESFKYCQLVFPMLH